MELSAKVVFRGRSKTSRMRRIRLRQPMLRQAILVLPEITPRFSGRQDESARIARAPGKGDERIPQQTTVDTDKVSVGRILQEQARRVGIRRVNRHSEVEAHPFLVRQESRPMLIVLEHHFLVNIFTLKHFLPNPVLFAQKYSLSYQMVASPHSLVYILQSIKPE
jgi:hypothetical protein